MVRLFGPSRMVATEPQKKEIHAALLAEARGIEVTSVTSRVEADVALRGFLGLHPGVP